MNAKTLRTIIANHPVLASFCDRIMGDAGNLAVLVNDVTRFKARANP